MTKVLVSGATGFIGRSLVTMLRHSEHEVVEMVRAMGDVADPFTWNNVESSNVVIHLAANTFVPGSWKNPGDYLRTNVQGTVCALDYCRKHGARFIYLSSYLYGNPSRLPIPESTPLVASNPYALSKKLAEEVCEFYSDNFAIKVTVIRPFNVFGPGQPDQFLIPIIINQTLKGRQIIVKDLEPKRDYIFIDDLLSQIIKSIDSDLGFEIYNAGTGESYSVQELINIIQDIAGVCVPVKSTNERRPGEIMDTKADITKALKILDWQPKFSLRSGLAMMLS